MESAISNAVAAHFGQVDKIGRVYILHPLQVMFLAERVFLKNPISGVSLEEFMAAAVLHDVSEDHPDDYPLDYILRQFGQNVHRIVDGVTRRKEQGETYRNFIVRAKQDSGSRLLKIVDIFSNLGRIHLLSIEEQSIRRRYERALDVLEVEDFSLEDLEFYSRKKSQFDVQGSDL